MDPLALLLVEDSEKDAALLLRELRRAGLAFDYERVATAAHLAEALERRRWDVVLSDYDLPGFGALFALHLVKAKDPDLPFIVVSGAVGEETAVEALRSGADDYVMKDRLLRLVPAIEREVRDAATRRARTKAAQRLAVQHEVTRLLAEASDLEQAERGVLEVLVRHLRWDAGVFWRRDGDVLCCTAVWVTPGRNQVEFERRAREHRFREGEGLVGRVWQTGAAVWHADVMASPEYRLRSLALHSGLHAAYLFPIFVDEELYGVVDLLNHDSAPPDEEHERTLQSAGSQLAQFVRRARAISALAESEAHKAAILEAAVDAIVSADHDGVILEWNRAAERLFGYTRAEAVGQDALSLVVPPALRESFREAVRHFVERAEPHVIGERVRTRGHRKDGSEFPAEITVARIGGQVPAEFTAYIRDVTRELRHDRNQRLLATASGGLSASLNYDKVLERVARFAVPDLADGCLVEVGEEEARHDLAVAHVDPGREAWARQRAREEGWRATGARAALERGEPLRYPPDPYGEPLDSVGVLLPELEARSWMSLPLIARGRAFGVLTLLRGGQRPAFDDVDLQIAEDLARRAAFAIDNARLYQEARESVRARDEFLSLIAHELKTPLTPLHLLLQSLMRALSRPGKESLLDPEVLLARLQSIRGAVERVEHLVENLLDISRMTVGPLRLSRRQVDLAACVRRVLERMEEDVARSGSSVDLSLEEGVRGCWDEERVEQLVSNLVSNAVKYGAGAPVEIGVCQAGRRARLTVRDHGIGVALSEQARIFERFGRVAPLRNYGGFGLGLWTARQIVDAHGGSIRIDSKPGEGALFVVDLPPNAAEERSATPLPP